MSTPIKPARRRASEATGKRDRSGRFTPKATLAEAALAANAAYPPLKKARLTMPEPDFARLRALKERLKVLDRPTRKNELLRAGLHALAALSDEALLLAVEQLPPAKAPKPPKPAKARKSTPRRGSGKRPAAKTKPTSRARKSAEATDD